MSKASTTELGDLHGALARALNTVISEGESTVIKDSDGEPTVVKTTASAAYFAAAITLLKNNNITADSSNSDLAALKQALADKRQRKSPAFTRESLDEAAELFGQRVQ